MKIFALLVMISVPSPVAAGGKRSYPVYQRPDGRYQLFTGTVTTGQFFAHRRYRTMTTSWPARRAPSRTGLRKAQLTRDWVVGMYFDDYNGLQPIRLHKGQWAWLDKDGTPRILGECGNPLVAQTPPPAPVPARLYAGGSSTEEEAPLASGGEATSQEVGISLAAGPGGSYQQTTRILEGRTESGALAIAGASASINLSVPGAPTSPYCPPVQLPGGFPELPVGATRGK